MRVLFHIGPHKTGTTSIQLCLLAWFGGETPRVPVWYPEPPVKGPGHAYLSSDELLQGQPLEEMRNVVAAAVAAGVETLVLSAEDFSYADSRRISDYATILAGHEVVLIYGQMPLRSRVGSLWKELVKHGATEPWREYSPTLLALPTLRSGVLTQYAEGLNPSRIAIVCSQPLEPAPLLINRCLQAMELPSSDPPAGLMDRHRNQSLSRFETEMLRLINLVGKVLPRWPSDRFRWGLYRRFSAEGRTRILPRWTLRLSPRMATAVEERAQAIEQEIETLGQHRSVSVYGELGR